MTLILIFVMSISFVEASPSSGEFSHRHLKNSLTQCKNPLLFAKPMLERCQASPKVDSYHNAPFSHFYLNQSYSYTLVIPILRLPTYTFLKTIRQKISIA